MSEERKRILAMLAEGKINPDEAEDLLDALGEAPSKQNKPKEETEIINENLTNLRIKVLSGSGDNVNIKIPLKLIRAGVKLGGVIPDSVKDKVENKLGEKGFGVNLSSIDGDNLEPFIKALSESEIKIIDKDEVVKIYCE